MSSARGHKQESLARLLLYALGVSPQEFYLLPDAQGWVSIKELMQALGQDEHSPNVREGAIREAVTLLAPQDLEITPSHIRARQRQPLAMEYAVQPPGQLYYAVKSRAYHHILTHGLLAGEQGPLVLSPARELALSLGQRRGGNDVIVVTIQARQAKEQGAVFDLLGEDMYLCQYIAPNMLSGPAAPEQPLKKAPARKPEPDPHIIPFMLNEDAPKPYKQKGLKKEVEWKNQRRKNRR